MYLRGSYGSRRWETWTWGRSQRWAKGGQLVKSYSDLQDSFLILSPSFVCWKERHGPWWREAKCIFCFWSQRVEGLRCSHLLQRSSVGSAACSRKVCHIEVSIWICVYIYVSVHHMIYTIYTCYIWYTVIYVYKYIVLQTYIYVCKSYIYMYLRIHTYMSRYPYSIN